MINLLKLNTWIRKINKIHFFLYNKNLNEKRVKKIYLFEKSLFKLFYNYLILLNLKAGYMIAYLYDGFQPN